MKVLVIGSGGREHTLVWKIAQSSKVRKLFCAPGNAGIARQARLVDIKAEDIKALSGFAAKERIDLTIVGPEAPLTAGIAESFEKEGLRIFGPSGAAARLEGSKVFAKEIMTKYNVPTAAYKVFSDSRPAKDYIRSQGVPLVVKADGLAAGKGVVVAQTVAEALRAVEDIMETKVFGQAGEKVVIEECLAGEEASILVITDGDKVVPLVSAQDHKRVFDNDQGLNTGGMGAYSPAPVVTDKLFEEIMRTIIYPVIAGMKQEGKIYKGVLYAGLMITAQGPKVVEFNVRFGDPETQVIVPRLKSDLIEMIEAVVDNRLDQIQLEWDKRVCVCVVMASGGYPGRYEKDRVISGLEKIDEMKDVVVFHSGTSYSRGSVSQPGQVSCVARPVYVTSGGRVLGVTAWGQDIKTAVDRVYQAVDQIHFDGAHYRRDIARRALNRSPQE